MPQKKITKADRGIAGFFGTGPLESAIRGSRFDVQEEMEILIGLARDPDPKVALPALKQFRAVIKEVASINAMFGSVQQTKKIEGHNEVVEQKVSTSTLLTNLRKDNEQDNPKEDPPHEIHRPFNS
tara:strand:+ start:16879 stop:17256 length:378 start_codon:yes stop_codon:yes gene_type:complete